MNASNTNPQLPSAENGTDDQSLFRKKPPIPFHPILFAVFPILLLYSRNFSQIELREVIGPLVYSVLGTVIVWCVTWLLTKQNLKGAGEASLVIVLFFFYGHLQNLLPVSLHWMSGAICLFALVLVTIPIIRTRRTLYDFNRVLNFFAFVLILPSLWSIGLSTFHKPESVASNGSSDSGNSVIKTVSHRSVAKISKLEAEKLPDIYYIILDAYGRSDRLAEYYHLDNRPFLKALKQRGFYIADRSGANYDQTPLCIASALNYNYLDKLIDAHITPNDGNEKARQLLDDNKVINYLSKKGYKYIHIGSGVGATRVDTADVELNVSGESALFEDEAMGLTPLESAPSTATPKYDEHRDKLIGAFNELDKVAKILGPKFVFAHVLAPHPPFVLGANGESVYPHGPLNLSDGSWLLESLSREDYIKGYSNQLKYVNIRVIKALDQIKKLSRHTPIIIVQGDHGSRMNLDWANIKNTDLREPFSILNAYNVPGKILKDLYNTITPINSFRVILHDLFGANLPLLPDKSYYSTAYNPFDYIDVTSQVRSTQKPLPATK